MVRETHPSPKLKHVINASSHHDRNGNDERVASSAVLVARRAGIPHAGYRRQTFRTRI